MPHCHPTFGSSKSYSTDELNEMHNSVARRMCSDQAGRASVKRKVNSDGAAVLEAVAQPQDGALKCCSDALGAAIGRLV